ncbi:MAG: Uma2 family endonuclease [Opitutus sp.]|nr:Uma2 family endonuclease [Opitutus sp.]
MDTATQPAPIARFLWDADRYEEAVARGIFTTEDPIELIDGEIITHMSPQYSPHATAIRLVSIALGRVFADGFDVRAQLPLRLGEKSLPEPDIAVVLGSPRDYLAGHPRTAELVVEVADSSLEIDRGRKLRLYAREGIPEYWIVNLTADCVEVRRRPVDEDYAEVKICRRGDSIPAGPEGRSVAVTDLLP